MSWSNSRAEKTLVSVIIPVYNGERYLSQALDSALGQSYGPIELIVVDDGSTDGSSYIARSYQSVRYLYQANGGPAAARNTGITASRGDFIAFLDHDDIWEPWKLRTEMDCFHEHPHLGYTMARGEFIFEEGTERPAWAVKQRGDGGPVPLHGALVVRRTVFDRVGPLNPSFRVAEDTEWIMRATDAHVPMMVLDGALVRRRVHATNTSYQQDMARESLFRAVRDSMHRQRAAGRVDTTGKP
jgi:glycosyltransferase involved in cell wall biosynthesis